jgi:hypothetical protein
VGRAVVVVVRARAVPIRVTVTPDKLLSSGLRGCDVNMVIPDSGKAYFLLICFGSQSAAAGSLHLRLFKNDYTPVDTSGLGDFTEADFSGYSEIVIAPADWDDAFIVSNVAEMQTLTAPSWTATAGTPNTVYGWYLVFTGSSIVVAAQRFDSPRDMSPGAVETLDPFKFKLKTFA